MHMLTNYLIGDHGLQSKHWLAQIGLIEALYELNLKIDVHKCHCSNRFPLRLSLTLVRYLRRRTPIQAALLVFRVHNCPTIESPSALRGASTLSHLYTPITMIPKRDAFHLVYPQIAVFQPVDKRLTFRISLKLQLKKQCGTLRECVNPSHRKPSSISSNNADMSHPASCPTSNNQKLGICRIIVSCWESRDHCAQDKTSVLQHNGLDLQFQHIGLTITFAVASVPSLNGRIRELSAIITGIKCCIMVH